MSNHYHPRATLNQPIQHLLLFFDPERLLYLPFLIHRHIKIHPQKHFFILQISNIPDSFHNCFKIFKNSSLRTETPPTRTPAVSGMERKSWAFLTVTEPP